MEKCNKIFKSRSRKFNMEYRLPKQFQDLEY